jgi:hypothetical protein
MKVFLGPVSEYQVPTLDLKMFPKSSKKFNLEKSSGLLVRLFLYVTVNALVFTKLLNNATWFRWNIAYIFWFNQEIT